MNRTRESFKRGSAKFKSQPKVLVICEDSKSSKIYMEEASIFYRSHTEVLFDHIGKTDPLNIVSEAVSRSRKYDWVFCVIDRDNHDQINLEKALTLEEINKNKVKVFISYPCFEYWLILHCEFSRAPFSSLPKSAGTSCFSKLKTFPIFNNYTKGNVNGLFKDLLPYLPVAKKHAIKTMQEVIAVNEYNPSTPLHNLIKILETLGNPISITEDIFQFQ
jgi:hypothetical protein